MAKLAIKGHPSKGKEVIKILEMMGGKNIHNYVGTSVGCYMIDDNKICITYTSVSENDNFVIFTLEEFLEKFPYKVGDKVTLDEFPCEITNMLWEYDTIIYYIKGVDFSKVACSNELQPYREETIKEEKDNWAKWYLPDGYEFRDKEGNVINTDTIRLVKKQPKYPKTYIECTIILNCSSTSYIDGYKNELLEKLQELLICRNAYWKIAGEQMRLEKPWKPDWCNENKLKYCIECSFGTIDKTVSIVNGCFLAFPTAEMRDAFSENFKELIEQCKELL